MTTKRQAKKGGEVGANGEWYQGGQFIAQADMPKTKPVKKSGKQQVAPYKWEIPADGMWSIWDRIGNAFGGWANWDKKDTIIIYPPFVNTPSAKMVELWNQGERWLSIDTMLDMGVFMPPMYLTEEQKPRNGK